MSTHAPRSSGISPVLISWRCICRKDSQAVRFCTGYSSPFFEAYTSSVTGTGTYSVTFACTSIYMEVWSRFPYCARVGDQALSRASIPSKAVREYVEWFKVCSHPFLLPCEGPNADFGVANNRVGYVSVSFYMFPFICFHNLNSVNYLA